MLRILMLFFVANQIISAHPSWGIVVTDDGSILIGDVLFGNDGALWKCNALTEECIPLQTEFHAHHMVLSPSGNVFAATAIWRSGSIEGEGMNFLFQIDPQTGDMDTLIYTKDWDQFNGNNFAMSVDERLAYFPMKQQIHIMDVISLKTTSLPATFDRICTIACDDLDNLWVTDSQHKNGTLFVINGQGMVTEVCSNFFPEDRSNALFDNPRHHLFYGIGFSEHGEPMICENVERSLWIINDNGDKNKVYQSRKNWHPTGVYFRDGKYYVLEYGFLNGNIGPRLVILNDHFQVLQEFRIDS